MQKELLSLMEGKLLMITTKIDPRTKLVIVLLLSTFAIIATNVVDLFFIFIASVFVSAIFKSDLLGILSRIKKLLGVMILIAVIQSLFSNMGQPVIMVGSFVILTSYGIIKAATFILRLGIIIFSASIIATSSSREIIQGLVQWHCPYEIAFMVTIAIRFLPIFKEEMVDMITAVQLRGIDLKRVKLKQKLTIYKYILMPIVVNTILKAKELSAAMEMRGFRALPHRTSYMVLKMQKKDYLIIISCFFAAIIMSIRIF